MKKWTIVIGNFVKKVIFCSAMSFAGFEEIFASFFFKITVMVTLKWLEIDNINGKERKSWNAKSFFFTFMNGGAIFHTIHFSHYPIKLKTGLNKIALYFVGIDKILIKIFLQVNNDFYKTAKLGKIFIYNNINRFVHNAPFLYLLKISENRKVFWCFQGVEKGCTGNKWVNLKNCRKIYLNGISLS